MGCSRLIFFLQVCFLCPRIWHNIPFIYFNYSIDWVESYKIDKTGVVITCKDDNVPSMGDLSRKISKDILPYVEFTNTSKQVESQGE